MAETIRKNVDLDILDYYDTKIKDYVDDKVGTGGVTIDTALSDTSTNSVQNKVIKAAIDDKADKTVATTEADGLMSASDKKRFNNIGNVYALKSLYGDTTIDVGRKTGTDVGICSDAEGWHTTASGNYSHAEGLSTTASNRCSHAEGVSTVASGESSHAEGVGAVAFGDYSHARGYNTITNNTCETASGKYNVSNDNTLFSIGDGTADDARHNAFEITTTGGKLHDKDIATTDLIPSTLPASGGNADSADTLTDWGTRTVTNANDAPFGFCAALDCENAPNTFWSTILTTGSSGATKYKTQIAFPWAFGVGENKIRYRCENDGEWGSWINVADGGNADMVDGKHAGDFAASINPTIIGSIKIMGYSTNTVQSIFPDGDTIRIRNLDSETSQTNNYADIVITTSGIFTEKAVNGVWQGRKELLTSTCVTGTSTIVDSNNFVSANFGFTPSAVLYAGYDSKTGIDDNYRLALNFNSDGFITQSRTAPPIGGGIETFSYIAFR